MNPQQQKKVQKSSSVHEQKKSTKSVQSRKEMTTDSSISMTFDSSLDVGYKSGDLSSQNIDDQINPRTSGRISESIKKEHSIRFDSGIGTDVFSPLPSESDIYYPVEEEDTISKKIENIEILQSGSAFVWQDIYNQDQDGDTILHLAIVEARSDVIFPLIRQAPHPDFLDILNDLCQTPLHLATLTGKSNIVRRLVAAGATLDKQNYHGNTALHIASKNGDLDCVQAILQPLEPEEIYEAQCPYIVYPEHNDLSHLINMKNYDGQTCIHLAAAGGYKKVLECLFDHGADINNQEGKSGKTALHFAIENANLELIQILVSRCHADIEAESYRGQPAIHAAFTLCRTNPQRQHRAIFEFLKRGLVEKWESPSDTESSSSEEIQSLDSCSGQKTPGNKEHNK